MRHGNLIVVLLMGVALVAGCTSKQSEGLPEKLQGSEFSYNAHEITMDGCVAWVLSRGFNPTESPPPVPEPWHSIKAPGEFELQLRGFACERLAVGPFERPVNMIAELHSNRTTPEGCEQPGLITPGLPKILHKLWLDDAEVAAYLAKQHGMPVGLASMTLQPSPNPLTPNQVIWKWIPEAGEESRIEYGANRTPPTPQQAWHSWAWFPGDTVSILLMSTVELNWAARHDPITVSVIRPPMLLARPQEELPSFISQNTDASAIATITSYEDQTCGIPQHS